MPKKPTPPNPTTYNPLNKENLGISVADSLLQQDVIPLVDLSQFLGAGIYALYYIGDFEPYNEISKNNNKGKFTQPIYVGKAVPAGARKGGFGLGNNPGNVLYKRLKEHADTISEVNNLELKKFFCRFLVVEDIWIPLGESLLIEKLGPIWNRILTGFGNHDPGKGRYNQQISAWDVVHPGRIWAIRLASNPKSQEDLIKLVKENC